MAVVAIPCADRSAEKNSTSATRIELHLDTLTPPVNAECIIVPRV
jgi:hypothetical protein